MFYTNNNASRIVDTLFSDLNTILKSSNIPDYTSKNYKTDSDDSGLTLTMNVPGYNKKLINVSVDGDDLVIEGKSNSGDSDGFTKRFKIGDDLDVDNIEANITDGVLSVSVPYLEEVKPRKIAITVG
jgi:HSP20 family molecular chaperone IbpA